ncbi:MAG TPA: biotin--[acetyl-CoA-carboxylase] ligase [Opitutaceae bacterium]|nr:biotin--[acetyl-CoA-carboxylase] ligase [Opitutaceae bacterium]
MNPPELVILRELLDREPGFVSGTALARKLGMSRVGVWMHMGKLRAQGFAFEAVRSRGYRLVRRPTGLNPLLVLAHLKPGSRQADLLCLPEVDSTNDEAERQLAAGRPTPFVVLARRQTVGRGRFGRVWHSEDNGNLYASFVFRPQLEPGRMQTFTLWMGANLCELVANFCHIEPGIKWPNDLYFSGRKLGGMLTEARVDADQIRDLVFGLGLNVNCPRAALPAALVPQATTLAECTGHPLDLNRLAAAIIGRVLAAYEQFVEDSHRSTFADMWNRFDLLRGKPVTLVQGSRRVAGIAGGIDDEGSLLIRGENGRPQRFHAGETTLLEH